MKGYDLVGNIAIVKFTRETSSKKKKQEANQILKQHNSITTVLEKTGKFKGRLRTLKTKFIAGINTKEALYKENNCLFRFNVETCYFSPRLSQERLEVAKMVKKGESVLVLFGGVAPFAIIIAKNAKPLRILSIELGRECTKYALENVKRNKVPVEIIQGNVRKILPKMKEQFDRVVMARPNLPDSFLDVTFPRIKKGGTIHYYGFYPEEEKGKMTEMIEQEAKKAKKKIKILRIKKAGDIGVRKFRYRADIHVLK